MVPSLSVLRKKTREAYMRLWVRKIFRQIAIDIHILPVEGEGEGGNWVVGRFIESLRPPPRPAMYDSMCDKFPVMLSRLRHWIASIVAVLE